MSEHDTAICSGCGRIIEYYPGHWASGQSAYWFHADPYPDSERHEATPMKPTPPKPLDKEAHDCSRCNAECRCSLSESSCWHECEPCDCGHNIDDHENADSYGHEPCSKCSCDKYQAIAPKPLEALHEISGKCAPCQNSMDAHMDAQGGMGSYANNYKPLEPFIAKCEVCGGEGPYFWPVAGRLVCHDCPEPIESPQEMENYGNNLLSRNDYAGASVSDISSDGSISTKKLESDLEISGMVSEPKPAPEAEGFEDFWIQICTGDIRIAPRSEAESHARAIWSAAQAPLLQKIAELEEKLREVGK